MLFSLLIVNYHTDEHINALLDSLSHQCFESFEVIIVNNAQQCQINTSRPFLVKLINSSYNQGFGRAMNLAASFASGTHLLIVNPDIVIKETDFLTKLYQALSRCDYGIATCRLLNNKGQDKSEFYGFEFDVALEKQNGIGWFSGAFLAISSSNYECLQGFDGDFFMYCEDEDLCLRATKKGLPFVKFNHLTLEHIGGVSEPIKSQDFFERWFRSQFLFIQKHLDGREFQDILVKINQKATKKYKIYHALKFLKIPRYLTKLNEWSAMKNVSEKILKKGCDWLYFDPKEKVANKKYE